MNYYYIDFENVKTAGLKGIDRLPSGDTVKIFAKGGSDQMKFNDIKTLMAAKATVTIEDVVTGTKNALDFQLLADLTIDCMKRAGMSPAPRFVIISADHGYDPAITQMKKRGVNNVSRAVSIKEATGDKEEKTQPAQKTGGRQPARKTQRNNAPKADEPSQEPSKEASKEALNEASKDKKPAPKKPQKNAPVKEEKTASKPRPRRVHTRTINKADKTDRSGTETANN